MGLRGKREDGPIEKPERREGYRPIHRTVSPQGCARRRRLFWSGVASESVSRTKPIPRAASDLAGGGKEASLYL